MSGGDANENYKDLLYALDRYLAWRSDTYSGPSDYLLVSAAGRVSDHPISKQTLSWPTFLGTSSSTNSHSANKRIVNDTLEERLR
jgi:hypothetical protein